MARVKCWHGRRPLPTKTCRRPLAMPPFIPSIRKAGLRPRKVKSRVSETTNSTQQNGFPFFTKLPLELRLKIWKMTTQEPRIVIVRTAKGQPGFTSPAPIPAALHICSESRDVALKKYKLCFPSRVTDNFKAHIFFNFDQDTLYFRGDWEDRLDPDQTLIGIFGSDINQEERDQIPSIAIDMNTGSAPAAFRYVNMQQWKGLRAIRLCLEAPRLDLESNLEFRLLEERDHWAFVRDYRRTINHRLCPKNISPSTAIENIREAHLDSNPVLKEILESAGATGFSLATVANS